MQTVLKTTAAFVLLWAIIMAFVLFNKPEADPEPAPKSDEVSVAFDFQMKNYFVDTETRTVDQAKDEIQGIAYRILCKERYASILEPLAHQIQLDIQQNEQGTFDISTIGKVGGVPKKLEKFLVDYRGELKAELTRNSIENENRVTPANQD